MGIKLINDDCLEYLEKNKYNNAIIVTDPPFNIGYHYTTYKDKMEHEKYMEMQNNLEILSEKLRTGYFTNKAIDCALEKLGEIA